MRTKSINLILATTTVFLALQIGCASKRTVSFASTPSGATVYASTSFSSEFKEVGQTPITVDLKKYAEGGKFTYLSLKSEGHDNYRMVLPSNYSRGSVEVKLNPQAKTTDSELRLEIEKEVREGYEAQTRLLKDQLELAQTLNQQRKIALEIEYKRKSEDIKKDYQAKSNLIFNKVIEIQNALHIKQMSKAGKALADMRALDPPPGLLLTLEGNFEFLNGRVNRALASYTRALDIDPTNVELAGVLADLKKAVAE